MRKSKSDLSNILPSDHKNLHFIMALCGMYGSEEIIKEAKKTFK